MRALTNKKTGAGRLITMFATVVLTAFLAACSSDDGGHNDHNNNFFGNSCVNCGGAGSSQLTASSLLMNYSGISSPANQVYAHFYYDGVQSGQVAIAGEIQIADSHVCFPPGAYSIRDTGQLYLDQYGLINGAVEVAGPGGTYQMSVEATSINSNLQSPVVGNFFNVPSQIIGVWTILDAWGPCNIGLTY